MIMKTIFRKVAVAVLLMAAVPSFAQAPLTDANVRTGKLDNGLTYYIRHNEYPKGQANFHIAQKVGAVQEEEHQNGLAHFLEHMCFNGTKNFPDKQLLTWLESNGVKFGMNLNAHTSTDETVYDITNVPVARESVVDSCLLILHDWADALTLADEEIEKERGVIHEEWRMGNGAVSRILNRHAPELYPNTKYATHDVIGSMDIIDNFKPQVLRDYYEKWYRPDLQGIIVVGDIDVDKVEQKIKDLFSPIKMPENPAKFEYQYVADNEEPIVISDSDKEMPANLLFVALKFDKMPRELRNTEMFLIGDYMEEMIQKMLSQRMDDIALGANAPFAGCSMYIDSYLYASVKGALLVQAHVNDKGTEAALRSVMTELKRVQEYGFTASEYDRARAAYLSELESKYNNRATDKNDVYAQIYIDNFINNTPIVGVDYIYEKLKVVAPMLPVDYINEYVKQIINGKNQVVVSMCPEKEGVVVPAKQQLLAVLDEVKSSPVEAYVDNTVDEPLISELPTAGSVISEKANNTLGYTELKLSNGATVLLKQTSFKEDEIMLQAESAGGASLYSAADYPNVKMACSVLELMGLGKFSYTDLQKVLSGKHVELSAFIDGYKEGVKGKSTPKDVETMMQLLYLTFTQPREDIAGYENVKKLMSSQMENLSRMPQYVFQDSLSHILYNHHPKSMIESLEMVNKLDYGRLLEIYKERFANAADFTFFISGNFDMEQMKQLVARYIASLPATGEREKAVNDGKKMVQGDVRRQFVFANEGKLAMMGMFWNANVPYTLENKVKIDIAGQLMANELLNSVREDEGAAYSPYSVGSLHRNYEDVAFIQTAFGLNPEKYKRSEAATIESLEKLAKNIPDSELNKMKEYMMKQFDEEVHENDYWIGLMKDFVLNGVDGYTSYKDVVKNLTVEEMKSFIAGFLKQGNRCEVLMLPE